MWYSRTTKFGVAAASWTLMAVGERSQWIVRDQANVEALCHRRNFLGLADPTCEADIGLDVVTRLPNEQVSKPETSCIDIRRSRSES